MFNTFVEGTSQVMNKVDSNMYIRTAIVVLLTLYGTRAREPLPPYIAALFNNIFFRVVILCLVAIIISKDVQIGIMVGTVFMLTLVGLQHYENMDTSEQLEHLVHIENFREYQERI
jgi:hypothetical protein